jgi:hypothetical protein
MTSNAPHRYSADRSPDWLDEIIEKARERGDFDNLPGHGKPLDLPPESSAPSEFDLAYTMLSNAGFAPWWMELGKEADRLESGLTDFRQRAADEISALRAELSTCARQLNPESSKTSRWRRFMGVYRSDRTSRSAQVTPNAIEHRRLELRGKHREMAEQFDAKLATFHAAMPRELWHVQRVRLAPETWDTIFDEACPPPDPD